MIKMVVCDIDGTILDKNYKYSKNTKKIIKKMIDNKIIVVLATGRMFGAAFPIAIELGVIAPLICYQGALIRNLDGNTDIIRASNTQENIAKEVIEILRDNNFHINLFMDDKLYVEKSNEIVKNYCSKRKIKFNIENFDNLTLKNIHKLMAIDYNVDKINKITKILSKQYSGKLNVVRSMAKFCEISDYRANKGICVEYLSKKYNINKSNILAIGDENNDIDLFKQAKYKIAMGNACDKLKEISTFVTKSVDDDGFFYAINKFVFNE